MTTTYVVMAISPAAYQEIRAKLVDAGYEHAIQLGYPGAREMLEMHGIALEEVAPPVDLREGEAAGGADQRAGRRGRGVIIARVKSEGPCKHYAPERAERTRARTWSNPCLGGHCRLWRAAGGQS